jgi:uncharacterized membrane protein
MPESVKRGLGWIVVAVIAGLIAVMAGQGDTWAANSVRGIAGATCLVTGFIGLGMLARGLLRD